MWYSILCLLFVSFTLAQYDDITTVEPPEETENLLKPIIKYLHYDTEIRNRYATTNVSSSVANPAEKAQEVSFGLILPETAFITGFVMIIKEKEYKAYIKEKEEAKQDYDKAVAAGQSAAHIQQDVRDSNRFQVSVNVEAAGKVTFILTYEELLSRTLGVYKNVINVNPGQIVKNLVVRVNITEPVPITHFSVPKFRTKNEISTEEEEGDSIAIIVHDSDHPNTAVVTWSPSTEQQVAIAKDGLQGQLVVEYDVSRTKSSQILLDEGYFVHFFTPNESVPALPKHVAFVLDISGSMGGRKIEQLREAMLKILSDLNEFDYFSIILFASEVIVWSPAKTPYLFPNAFNSWSSHNANDPEVTAIINRRDTNEEILPATSSNIEKAKEFVKKISATDATNIMGGLRNGIDLINKGQEKYFKDSNKVEVPQPIIVFLTDGQPNVEISDPNEIVNKTVELNVLKTPIFSLAFGDGADLQFLRRLSLKNNGFARNIYEASDAALQLNNFYREISSPLLADVNFSYLEGQVENGTLTKHQFPILFRGTEVVIAGLLRKHNCNDLSYQFSAAKNSDASIDYKSPDRIIIFPSPRPCIPIVNETNVPGHLEKLWAFLTIKQLLDKDTSNKDDPKSKSPEKEEALKLALKYSFVTPLTSLVVVKPNDSDTTVLEPEKAASSPSFGSPMFGAFPAIAGFPAGASFSSAGFSGASGLGGFPVPSMILTTPRPGGISYSMPIKPTYSTSVKVDLTTLLDAETTTEVLSTIPTAEVTVSSSESTPVPSEVQIPVENVSWLGNYVTDLENFLISVPGRGNFTVGYNQTDNNYGECHVSSGSEFHGYCRHLQFCPLSTFASSIDEYVAYFCPIANGFAGVCCPWNAKNKSYIPEK